tara:strand:- start:46 stop:462 length:417 start_codon:yes stop_codon:yes gene_type:complete
MAKMQKQYITPMWLEIKEFYEQNTKTKAKASNAPRYGTNFPIGGELDKMSSEFVSKMGVLTRKFGWECIIEDVHMNLWKERIWSLIENAGLLPEIAWRDDKEKDRLETQNDYYNDEEYDFPEEEPTDLDSNKHINIFE